MRLPFHGRFERFHELEREKREAMPLGRDETPPIEAMEKGDMAAMLIAAMITIVPVCLLVLAILALAGYFFIV